MQLAWRPLCGRSADFQSAVSPNCIRQGVGSLPRVGVSQRLAELSPATKRDAQQRITCDPMALNSYDPARFNTSLGRPTNQTLRRC